MIYFDCQELGLRQANNSAWLKTFLMQGMVCSQILATWKTISSHLNLILLCLMCSSQASQNVLMMILETFCWMSTFMGTRASRTGPRTRSEKKTELTWLWGHRIGVWIQRSQFASCHCQKSFKANTFNVIAPLAKQRYEWKGNTKE